jgi:hypothetical protein
VWDELGSRTHQAAEQKEDAFEALACSGRAFMRFALEHPVQYRILMMRPSTSEGVTSAASACVAYLAEGVAACVEAGVLRGDPEKLALNLLSVVHGCVSLLIAQPAFPWPEDLDAFFDNTIWMAGLGAALSSRIPRDAVPGSAELGAQLDVLASRITGSQ